jgi:hypothetical protein
MSTADIRVENHGTVWIFTPLSESAKLFFDEELDGVESWQWMGNSIIVDHRPARLFYGILVDNGFSLI